VKTMSWPCIV